MTTIRNLAYLFTAASLFLVGCGLFKKKDIEDSDEYKKNIQYEEQNNNKFDSLSRTRYQEMLDSNNRELKRHLDSLKVNADSIKKSIEERIDKQNKQNK